MTLYKMQGLVFSEKIGMLSATLPLISQVIIVAVDALSLIMQDKHMLVFHENVFKKTCVISV